MIIDGVFASQAIDSSGEVLDVEGCDISTLAKDGIANYEHKEGDKKGSGNNGEEIVGKILYAKKIYSAKDCDTDREKKYWDDVKVPYIYGMVRLYDGAGHSGAQALAAQIRDHHANAEPILVRFSIEGSTLERDGQNLKASVARRVALTLKPCNRTAVSGLIEDPRAPAGFEKRSATPEPEIDDILAGLVEKGEAHEHPNYTRLGGAVEIQCSPVVETEDFTKSLKLLIMGKMLKALAAGSYDAAPGSLVGGSALQKEDRGLRNRMKRAVAEYRPTAAFDKSEFKAFAKTFLPEADDSFMDHFADVAHDYHMKRGLRKDEAKPAKAPKSSKKAQQSLELGEPPLTVRGKAAKIPNVEEPTFDEKKGVLHTPRGSFPMYIPSRDKTPGAKESFHHIMHDKNVNKFHDYAMENWSKVNELLKKGKLPPQVVMHATLFSQLSPNTPVPMQELMYGHLIDSMKHTGVDATSPHFGAAVRQDWLNRDQPDKPPEHSAEHWDRLGGQIRLKNPSYMQELAPGAKSAGRSGENMVPARDEQGNKIVRRPAGSLMSFMLANDKFDNMAQYHGLHDKLVDLVNRHKEDARAGVGELMKHKVQGENWENVRKRHVAQGKLDPGPYTEGPAVNGLAPKTARYTYGMMGGGNVTVPDTHFIRYLFGLQKPHDAKSIEYLKSQLWNGRNSHLLEAIDRYYAKHHDAVQHMIQHPRWGQNFKNPEEAIFPAFWKNWVAIAPHEAARGLQHRDEAHNEQTDHKPFWDAIHPFTKSEEWSLPARTAMIHHKWVQDHGEVPALMLYYAHIVPKLLENHALTEVDDTMRKFEALSIDLSKAMADKAKDPNLVEFGGNNIVPGCAHTAKGKMALLHENATHYVAIPHDKLDDFQHTDLVRLPKALQDTHYRVTSRPSVPVSDLEE